jgi:hypothetical protein
VDGAKIVQCRLLQAGGAKATRTHSIVGSSPRRQKQHISGNFYPSRPMCTTSHPPDPMKTTHIQLCRFKSTTNRRDTSTKVPSHDSVSDAEFDFDQWRPGASRLILRAARAGEIICFFYPRAGVLLAHHRTPQLYSPFSWTTCVKGSWLVDDEHNT